MLKVVVALTLCVGMSAAASAQDAKAEQAAKVALGEKVYAAQKCATCHSIGKTGNKKGPLDGVASRLTAEELREWVVDAKAMTTKTKAPRKPLMRSYTLPKEDLDALVAYMLTLKK